MSQYHWHSVLMFEFGGIFIFVCMFSKLPYSTWRRSISPPSIFYRTFPTTHNIDRMSHSSNALNVSQSTQSLTWIFLCKFEIIQYCAHSIGTANNPDVYIVCVESFIGGGRKLFMKSDQTFNVAAAECNRWFHLSFTKCCSHHQRKHGRNWTSRNWICKRLRDPDKLALVCNMIWC